MLYNKLNQAKRDDREHTASDIRSLSTARVRLRREPTVAVLHPPSQLSFAALRNLRPDVTPPEAAVGNEEENARRWEKATNKADCEEAAGLWDASANKCIEKKM